MPSDTKDRLIVAIDGPSGAGKSTVAMSLARELGYLYMDTGAMYRAVALNVLESKTDPSDEKELGKILEDIRVKLIEEDSGLRLLLNGRDVTEEIRTPEMSQLASKISELQVVRERMVAMQRDMASQGGVVVEGRDIGTVVFPRAEVKIYLDASEAERARKVVRALYNHYLQHPDEIPSEYQIRGNSVERWTLDYIAGMTDRYALRMAEELSLVPTS